MTSSSTDRVTPLPVWLAEKAETLRSRVEGDCEYLSLVHSRPIKQRMERDRSLADLIDGMLAERERLLGEIERLTQCGDPYLVLALLSHMDSYVMPPLAQHVATILGESIPDES